MVRFLYRAALVNHYPVITLMVFQVVMILAVTQCHITFFGKKGLNWYDYGARHYDAALGRFTTNDRFSKKYHSLSPYQYGANNPVNTIDIKGDSLLIVTPAAIEAIYNGLQDGSNIKMQFNNGILDPTSIAKKLIVVMISFRKTYLRLPIVRKW